MTETAPVETAERNLNLAPQLKSLLVIEDDLSLIQFIDLMLDDLRPGLEWEYVTSGEEALELIRRRGHSRGGVPYSLVMTDIFLEGDVTGFDVWLECQREFPEMPFVVTSALSFDRYFTVLRNANSCPVFLPKPLTVARCRSVFEEYLS